jgi:DNA modification methylase
MASGEMSVREFTEFLRSSFNNMVSFSVEGSIHYVCMDWRHIAEMLEAGQEAYTELKNLIVWVKDNGGMGSFYRSRHELVFVFKAGTARHQNNFGLGQHGRYRTNVWEYRGINSLHAQRGEELAMHPTVKPVEMIADAILDVSSRGGRLFSIPSAAPDPRLWPLSKRGDAPISLNWIPSIATQSWRAGRLSQNDKQSRSYVAGLVLRGLR